MPELDEKATLGVLLSLEASMRTMSAEEAETRCGELLLEAQEAPVTIERNGEPVAVVYSMEWHEAAAEAKLDWLKRAVAEGVAQAHRGEVIDFDSDEAQHEFFEDLKRECRASLAEEEAAGG